MNREERMAFPYRNGRTHAEVGAEFGVTRERVRQILKKQGITGADGGAHLRAQVRHAAKGPCRSELKYGLPMARIQELRRQGFTRAYLQKQKHAAAIAVPFELTLEEFVDLWERSGRWSERGRGASRYGLVMFDPKRGITPENVFVGLNKDAGTLARLRAEPHDPEMRGIHCLYPGLGKPYIVLRNSKAIGRCATIEEAKAIRDAAEAAHA